MQGQPRRGSSHTGPIRYLTPSFPLSAGGEGEAEGRG